MGNTDDAAQQPVIVLRVVIRSPDVDTFIAKYSRFVKDDRIFIFTKSSQPAGTRVRFTLELADGQPLIHGEGTVTRIRAETDDAARPPGMELSFQPVDDASRALVARMAATRLSPQFREESTDVQTQVRGGGGVPVSDIPMTRDFDERPATLPALEKTGAHEPVTIARLQLHPRQDESGAVTLSHEFRAADVGFSTGPTGVAAVNGERPSGSGNHAMEPTPLPRPLPPGSEESFVGSAGHLVQVVREPGRESEEPHFGAGSGPVPTFAESFRGPIPGGPRLPPGLPEVETSPQGLVPANPFSNVSDGAIEYFVEWSLEQSTKHKARPLEASFANVKMVTAKAEKVRIAGRPLAVGIAIGVLAGAPLGAVATWLATRAAGPTRPGAVAVVSTPLAAPASGMTPASATPPSGAGTPSSGGTPSSVVAPSSPPSVGSVATLTEAKPLAPAERAGERPADPADKPAEPGQKADEKPVAGKGGELQVTSNPAGARVTIDGAARGKTPLTLSLPPGAHEVRVDKERYATWTQSTEAPAKLDVSLRRPQATLHVESEPPGGDVVVEGKARGKTPVDVTVEGFHHYDVQVTLLGTTPWRKRVSVKPPQTDVNVKLSVVHAP